MQKKTYRKEFWKSMYILYTIAIMIPVILISTFFSAYYSLQFLRQHEALVENAIEITMQNIQQQMTELERILFTPYLYNDISMAMRWMRNGFVESPPEYMQVSKSLDQYSMMFIKLLHTAALKIERITFYPLSAGCERAYEIKRTSSSLESVDISYGDAQWFQNVLTNGNDIYLSDISHEESQEYFFFAARPIKDYDSKKVIGVLRLDVHAQSMMDQVITLHLTEHSFASLFNRYTGKFYASFTNELDQEIQAVQNGEEVVLQGSKVRVIRKPVNGTNWDLFYFLSVGDTNLTTSTTVALVGILCLLTLALSFVIYQKRSARLIRALNEITRTIHLYEEGDLDAICTVDDENEFQLIAQALNIMGNRLKEYIQKECDARMEKLNAEYLALQSQINPHFLNNTLNGLIGLNRCGEKKLLESSILQLSSLFRYTCKNDYYSTVREELSFVRQYLELQKLRFGDRLDYQVEATEDALSFTIPKLLIQPIVENSIIHGMEPSDDPIMIHIEATMIETVALGKCLEIKVEDNGIGFDSSLPVATKLHHVGIENIKQRIMRFHANAVFNIESMPGDGALCRIRIPQERGKL